MHASRLTWDMFDPRAWTLTLRGTITKNKARQVLKLDGEVRAIMARRLQAHRLDCPLIFHRVSKGEARAARQGLQPHVE